MSIETVAYQYRYIQPDKTASSWDECHKDVHVAIQAGAFRSGEREGVVWESRELCVKSEMPVIPHDFFSHRNSWRAAFERLIELEPESHRPDEDEKGFWKHEYSAFQLAYKELDERTERYRELIEDSAPYKELLRLSNDQCKLIDALQTAGKYDEVLLPFKHMMEKELHANSGKGDRPAWLKMSASECLLEIYYHVAKLQKAVKDSHADGIIEYTADVANMCMMLADICGAIDLVKSSTIK